MTRVIQRCSTCGLEHDHPVAECEACRSPLRYWCRAHSADSGWLDAPACPRCAEEKARPVPRPAAAPPAPARPPRPAPPPPRRRTRPSSETGLPRPVVPVSHRPRPRADGRERQALLLFIGTMAFCAAILVPVAYAGSVSVGTGAAATFLAGLVAALARLLIPPRSEERLAKRRPPRDPRAPMEWYQWVDSCAKQTFVIVVSAMVLCGAGGAGYQGYRMVRTGWYVADEMVAGAFLGMMMGVFAGGALAVARILWLSRAGGPLEPPPE